MSRCVLDLGAACPTVSASIYSQNSFEQFIGETKKKYAMPAAASTHNEP